MFFLLVQLTFAQNEEYIATSYVYTYKDGLPGNEVTSARLDNKGYLWVSCKNNLCRFDGKKFWIFNQKTSGIKNKNIWQVMSDGRNGMIIMYDNRFLNNGNYDFDVIDINSFKVTSFENYYPNCPFKLKDITAIELEKTDRILFTLKSPKLSESQALFEPIKWSLNNAGTFSKYTTKAIMGYKSVVEKGRAIVKASPVTSVLDIAGNDFLLYSDSTRFETIGKGPKVVLCDDEGMVVENAVANGEKDYYFLSYNGPFVRLGTDTARYKKYMYDARNDYGVWEKNKFAAVTKPNGTIVIYSAETDELPVVDSLHNPLLHKAKLNRFYNGKDHLWMCTTEGLIKIEVGKKKFQNYFNSPQEKNNAMRGLFVGAQYEVFSSNDYIVIHHKGEVHTFRNPFNFSALEIGNELLVGSYELKKFNPSSKKLENVTHSISDEIWSMYALNDSVIMLGCTYDLDIYNTTENRIRHIDYKQFPGADLVYRIFKADSDRVVAVANNGVYFLNKEAKIVGFLSTSEQNKSNDLPFSAINDLHIDENGVYWFATAAHGLYRWDRRTNRFENFGNECGLISTTLCRIEEDEKNNLWIGTNMGLACFNKATGKARVYTVSDGIVNNEFNRVSSFKDKHGMMYFGTIDGFTKFDPRDFSAVSSECNIPFNLTVFRVYNASTNLEEEIDVSQKIELTDGKKNLRLSVLLMDFEETNHLYSYQIAGLSNEPTFFRDETISITDLPYGDYTIVIRAQCSNGMWNKRQIFIPVSVIRPVYKRWWFILLAIAICIAGIYLYVRKRISRIKDENEKLDKIVGERTLELKQSLAEQTALLQEVHHRVKNNLQFVAAMLQMQIASIKDEGNKAVLSETSRRINSMSLVHEMLYNKDKLEYIEVKKYLNELIHKLREFVYDPEKQIEFKTDVGDYRFSVNDCVALGMVTSEIISNSIKYAFAVVNTPVIDVSLKKEKDNYIFMIGDNGPGMGSAKGAAGLGLRLIDIFARQLEAEYEVKNKNGLVYLFKFEAR